jgi:hypothetical protein
MLRKAFFVVLVIGFCLRCSHLQAQRADSTARKAKFRAWFPSADSLRRMKPEDFELKVKFNESGSSYLKVNLWNQVWFRYTETNPGTAVYNDAKSGIFDIGLRRLRIQALTAVGGRVFFYIHFGMNNFNYISARKAGAFFHDATAEFAVVKKFLVVGGGLSGWSGLSRFTSPSTVTIMSLDAPIFEQSTVDINDQFSRRLSFHLKGQVKGFDYRIALSQPFAIQNVAVNTVAALGSLGANEATWSLRSPNLMYQAYVKYNFFDQEENYTPYSTGTYLGKKKVLALGFGFQYQPDAMWYKKTPTSDTASAPMRLFAIDIFGDMPTAKGRTDCISFYAAYFNNYYGPNYVRFVGVMNPATGNVASKGLSYPGSYGNAFAMEGTGNMGYFQLGYKLKDHLLSKAGTLMPYVQAQVAKYDKFTDVMVMWEAGLNWFVIGHKAKITFNYQNRPVYHLSADGNYRTSERKSMYTIQFQVYI